VVAPGHDFAKKGARKVLDESGGRALHGGAERGTGERNARECAELGVLKKVVRRVTFIAQIDLRGGEV